MHTSKGMTLKCLFPIAFQQDSALVVWRSNMLRIVSSMGWEDPLEEGMATPSNVLAWRIPWTEEPGGL